MESPRVLTLTFQFRVPPGLRANIRGARINAAILAFITAMQNTATTVFPWADRVTVNYDWSYRWHENRAPRDLPLAPTPENSPGTAAVADEEPGMADELTVEP